MPTAILQEDENKTMSTAVATPNINNANTNKTEPKTPANTNNNSNANTNNNVTPNGINKQANNNSKPMNNNNNQNGSTDNKNPNQNRQNNNQMNKNNNNNRNNNNRNNNNQNKNQNKQNFNNNNNNNNNKSSNNNNNNNNNNKKQNIEQHQSSNFSSSTSNMNGAGAGGNQVLGEKKFTGRCRLFVGNLPSDITESEFRDIFVKYGEIGECFLNNQRSFGFIKLDTRLNAENAKQDLDGFMLKGRSIRVRFASHGAAVRVKNLSPHVSNEYLEQAFSIFGPVERAVVIVDDKGRPTGEGIVEFERKPAATQCLNKCTEGCFILTSYPKPVIVEPLEQKDDEDGLSEKSIIKNAQFHSEREVQPHFAQNNSFEFKLAIKWRELFDLEKQILEEGKKRIDQAREMLEYEIEQAMIDHKSMKLKEELRAKQEELQRMEDMRKSEYQRRQEMEMRRQEEMMMMRKQQEMMRGGGNQQNGGFNDQNGLMNQVFKFVYNDIIFFI